MQHLMIDLETLDVTPTSTILTIGAQGFDPFSDHFTEDTFYVRVDLDSQENRTINESTIKWWSKQDSAVREEAFSDEDRIPLKDALEQLSKIAFKYDKIWANGILFDIAILENAMYQTGVHIPWKYFQVMDARTIYQMFPGKNNLGNSHNALEDCVNQIILLQKIFKENGITSFQ